MFRRTVGEPLLHPVSWPNICAYNTWSALATSPPFCRWKIGIKEPPLLEEGGNIFKGRYKTKDLRAKMESYELIRSTLSFQTIVVFHDEAITKQFIYNYIAQPYPPIFRAPISSLLGMDDVSPDRGWATAPSRWQVCSLEPSFTWLKKKIVDRKGSSSWCGPIPTHWGQK